MYDVYQYAVSRLLSQHRQAGPRGGSWWPRVFPWGAEAKLTLWPGMEGSPGCSWAAGGRVQQLEEPERAFGGEGEGRSRSPLSQQGLCSSSNPPVLPHSLHQDESPSGYHPRTVHLLQWLQHAQPGKRWSLGGKPVQPGWPWRTSRAPGWVLQAEQNRHTHPTHNRRQELWMHKAQSKDATPKPCCSRRLRGQKGNSSSFGRKMKDLSPLLKKPCQALEPPQKEAGFTLEMVGAERPPCSLLCFMQASAHGYLSKTGD